MTSQHSYLIATLFGIGLLNTLQAADFKVITSDAVTVSEISASEIKEIFLETKTSLAGAGRVEPVLAKGGPAHEAFLKQLVGKTDAALVAYYRGLIFTGKGSMPKVFASDAEVAAYIAKSKGAIGYVSADAELPGVKTLEVK